MGLPDERQVDKLQAEGKGDQLKGKLQDTVGQVKRKLAE